MLKMISKQNCDLTKKEKKPKISAYEIISKSQELSKVAEKYPVRITNYYFNLIEKENDGVWKQCMPDKKELMDDEGLEDPLNEEGTTPIPGLTHRYPDRVLLLISNVCAMYCRFCTRKRKVGKEYETISDENFERAIQYIKNHPQIRDVILSGGDPFMLSTEKLEYYIKAIRQIKHVEIIRIGTRVPVVYPQRVNEKLANMLKKYHPIYVNTHFNHPHEITSQSTKACDLLANVGIPLGNQSVLLKGVNDDPEIMKELVQKLLKIRVKPYYLYFPDITKGTAHLRPNIKQGLKIIESIRGWTSGMAVPHLIIDIEGGGGKIPILPEYLVSKKENKYIFRNYEGKLFYYKDV